MSSEQFVEYLLLFQIMVAGLGWAFADFLLTRVLFLWVGARGVEFDWKYLQVIKFIVLYINLVFILLEMMNCRGRSSLTCRWCTS